MWPPHNYRMRESAKTACRLRGPHRHRYLNLLWALTSNLLLFFNHSNKQYHEHTWQKRKSTQTKTPSKQTRIHLIFSQPSEMPGCGSSTCTCSSCSCPQGQCTCVCKQQRRRFVYHDISANICVEINNTGIPLLNQYSSWTSDLHSFPRHPPVRFLRLCITYNTLFMIWRRLDMMGTIKLWYGSSQVIAVESSQQHSFNQSKCNK